MIANRKSGNNDGAAILASFRSHLNPAQVCKLGTENVKIYMSNFAKIQDYLIESKNSENFHFQVVDLDETSMEDGLKLCQMIYENNGIRSICLVAGGDGTIG